MLLREMKDDDLDRIVYLDQLLFDKDSWTKEDFLEELHHNPFAHYYILEDKEILGYIGLWFTYEQATITTIGVDKQYQHQGYGSYLVEKGLEYSHLYGCTSCSLEVKVSNEPAIHLYKKYGFQTVTKRKNYYQDHSDAYLMVRERRNNGNHISD